MLSLTTHQLKTPLAGVRALLQSLGNGSIPAELHARFLNQGIAECDRLEHLVETTLAYQRTVARGASQPEVIPARQLVSEILEHRRASFPDDDVRWEPTEQVSVTVRSRRGAGGVGEPARQRAQVRRRPGGPGGPGRGRALAPGDSRHRPGLSRPKTPSGCSSPSSAAAARAWRTAAGWASSSRGSSRGGCTAS